METYNIKNKYGEFVIILYKDLKKVVVYGNIKASKEEFKKINKKPPNDFGTFYKRERAGYSACLQIIKNYNY